MGTSFINIGEYGFWARDSLLELWLRLLALHIEEPEEKGETAHQIRDRWLLASKGIFNGCVPTDLEEAVSTKEGKEIVLNAIVSLLDVLKNAPEKLDKHVLNLLGFEGCNWSEDIEKVKLIEIGEAFVGLIEGEIKSDRYHG